MEKKRPPLRGYNHNFRYREHVYHVQTEDTGPERGMIISELFHQGVLISAIKTSYTNLKDQKEKSIQAHMQEQHKQLLRQLSKGQFDDFIAQLLDNNPQPALDADEGFYIEHDTELTASAEKPNQAADTLRKNLSLAIDKSAKAKVSSQPDISQSAKHTLSETAKQQRLKVEPLPSTPFEYQGFKISPLSENHLERFWTWPQKWALAENIKNSDDPLEQRQGAIEKDKAEKATVNAKQIEEKPSVPNLFGSQITKEQSLDELISQMSENERRKKEKKGD